jgi:hypothetical protein
VDARRFEVPFSTARTVAVIAERTSFTAGVTRWRCEDHGFGEHAEVDGERPVQRSGDAGRHRRKQTTAQRG